MDTEQLIILSYRVPTDFLILCCESTSCFSGFTTSSLRATANVLDHREGAIQKTLF